MFHRIDTDHNNTVEPKELERFLNEKGLSGFIGGPIAAGAARLFLDQVDASRGATWEQFKSGCCPKDLRDPNGRPDPSKFRRAFEALAQGRKTLTAQDLQGHVRAQLPAIFGPMLNKVVTASAEVALEAFDMDQDGRLSRQDLEASLEALGWTE
jgi:hypothetical protein